MGIELYLSITTSHSQIFHETPRVKKEKTFYSTLTIYTIISLLQLIAEGLNKTKKILQE